MVPYKGKVTTGDRILPELYEISARIQATGKMDFHVSNPVDVYKSAFAWLRIEAAASLIDGTLDNDAATPGQMRSALLDLAADAVRWAREIREQCQ